MPVRLLNRNRRDTRLELANAIFEYLETFHNGQRRHSPLGMLRSAKRPAPLSTRQRGRLVRALAEVPHVGPDSVAVRVARSTADEWIRAWRAGGFEALKRKAPGDLAEGAR